MKFLAYFIAVSSLWAQQPGWFSDKEYENVKVSFEYKLAQWAEAAIVLRTPKIGRPVQQGVSVFLAHDFHKKLGKYVTGAIAGEQEPMRLLPESWDKWHKVELTLSGDHIDVAQDGELIQQARVPIQKLGKGYLHFADLLHRYEVRNLKIVELPAGRQYSEIWSPWSLRGAGTWVKDTSEVTGADGTGILYGAPVLKDFLFSTEVRATNHANGGVFFRGNPDAKFPRGFEVQIYSPLDSVYPTGSIYGLSRSTLASDTEDRWFYLQVLVRGQSCRVWVDGVLVGETRSLPAGLVAGQIGLQIHMEKTSVHWKNLRAFSFD